MNKLEETIQTVKQKQDFVKKTEQEIKEPLPVSALRAKTGLLKRAKLDLIELYRQYRTSLQSSTLFIITTGSDTDQFIKIAEEEYGCFSVKADSFYENILNQVPEKVYKNQQATSALFDHFSAKFEDRALEIDIIGYQPLLFESKYKKPLTNKEDALQLIKRAFNEKVGAEVVALDAIDRITEKAIVSDFHQRFCPIVLHTQDPLLVKELEQGIKRTITGNVFVVSVGSKLDKSVKKISFDTMKTANNESIKKTLLKIKEKLV